MGFKENFLKVLADTCEERGQSGFARDCGVPQASLSRIILGKTPKPSLDNVGAIVDAIGIEAFSPVIKRTGSNSPVERVEGSGLPTIPVYGSTGAGDPQEFWSMAPEREIEVLPQYARPGMVALRVEGDSMEPTISKGAYVGIAPLNGGISEGGIYLVNVPLFGRVIKRLHLGDGGSLELISDNRKYPPTRLPVEQYDSIVIGKVAWVWQEL